MFGAWLVSVLVLGLVTQSLASLEALEDKITLLKAAFHRQTDETNERIKTLQKEVDDLKRENLNKDEGKFDTVYINMPWCSHYISQKNGI